MLQKGRSPSWRATCLHLEMLGAFWWLCNFCDNIAIGFQPPICGKQSLLVTGMRKAYNRLHAVLEARRVGWLGQAKHGVNDGYLLLRCVLAGHFTRVVWQEDLDAQRQRIRERYKAGQNSASAANGCAVWCASCKYPQELFGKSWQVMADLKHHDTILWDNSWICWNMEVDVDLNLNMIQCFKSP